MNGSPVAGLVRGWVDLYTRGLPADTRAARRDEIDDDLWCEHSEAAAAGRSARSLDADLVLRLLFGMPADVSWRLTHRRVRTPPSPMSSPMNTRPLGVLAIVAGSSLVSLVVLAFAMGDALWTSAAAFLVPVLMIAFIATALGLVWRFHDHLSPLGMVGAILVALGSALLFAPIGAIAAGSAMLMRDLAEVGVLSRRAAILNLAAAIPLIGIAVANLIEPSVQLSSTDGVPVVNALGVVLTSPFAVSWVAIGVSLLRGVPQAQAQSG